MNLRVKPILSALAVCAAFVSTNANAILYNITGDFDFGSSFDIEIDVTGTDVMSVDGDFFQTGDIVERFTGSTAFPVNNKFTDTGDFSFSFKINPSAPSGNIIRLYTENKYVIGKLDTGPQTLALTISDVEVSAVPEPETYAMFLAGLGLLGFARRAAKS